MELLALLLTITGLVYMIIKDLVNKKNLVRQDPDIKIKKIFQYYGS